VLEKESDEASTGMQESSRRQMAGVSSATKDCTVMAWLAMAQSWQT